MMHRSSFFTLESLSQTDPAFRHRLARVRESTGDRLYLDIISRGNEFSTLLSHRTPYFESFEKATVHGG